MSTPFLECFHLLLLKTGALVFYGYTSKIIMVGRIQTIRLKPYKGVVRN